MKTVRTNVFETNSSSVHTVCLLPPTDADKRKPLPTDENNNVVGSFNEFGWDGNCSTPGDKLSYLLVMIWETLPDIAKPDDASIFCANETERKNAIEIIKDTVGFKIIEKVLKEYGGYNGLVISSDYDGYIDHQSCETYETLNDFLEDWGIHDEEGIYDFIVGPSYITIDNDNH